MFIARAIVILSAIVCFAPGLSHSITLAPSLRQPPVPISPSATPISGHVQDREALAARPRAVLGWVSDKQWALLEFMAMMHASWRHLMASAFAGPPGVRVDLFAFTDERWADQLATICTVLDLDADFGALHGSPRAGPRCFVVRYPLPPTDIWHGYPFINNVHFFADERVARILTGHYGYVMKSDFDTFLTPALLRHNPPRLLFGIQEYALLPQTQERLVRVASDLGLTHRGRHNLGPTWLGDAATLVEMANRTIPVLHHILTREFEQLPEGGIAQKWQTGEGFPLWSAGMAAMYATEIVANHFIEGFDSTLLMDMHADSELSIDEVLHIHCRHGDGDFSKFEFFQHHYDNVDISNLDLKVVKNYAMQLAVSTWRYLNKQPPQGTAPLLHSEL